MAWEGRDAAGDVCVVDETGGVSRRGRGRMWVCGRVG